MSKNLLDTCVFWSCVTRCGCGTTSSTLFTVHIHFYIQCIQLNNLLASWYFLPALLCLNEVEVDTKGGGQVVNSPLLARGVL